VTRLFQQRLPDSDLSRRDFLAAGLGWLAFWRRTRKLSGIEFRRIRGRGSSRRFLLIHGNESTARDVLTAHMKSAAGTAWLVEHETRNVDFKGGLLDPNRMFSSEGADRNLRRLNPAWPEVQLINCGMYLDRKRHEILDAVRPARNDVLIAVHNNSEGYSVRDEIAISDRVKLNDESNPHEFCLCSDPSDFEVLSRGSYNVVLQSGPSGRDDGSLSRLAAREGFRYVNIEAGLGRFEKQAAMLRWVDSTLPAAHT
jgi:hypothetical protein